MNLNNGVQSIGRLDGLVIFRYALIGKNIGGGIEEHLSHVNRLLLERNNITIYQTYFNETEDKVSEKIEKIGRGRIIWIPMKRHNTLSSKPVINYKIWPWLTDNIFSQHILQLIKKPSEAFKKINWFKYYSEKPGQIISIIHKHCKIDLVILHSLSSRDDVDIIRELVRLKIPFTAIHHFENYRLSHPMVWLKLRKFKNVGLVSAINVPPYLRNNSFQICEGIDINFFKNTKNSYNNKNRIILLPARISRKKGQYDLIQAIHLLNKTNIKVNVALAGRVDDEEFMKELNDTIVELNESEKVLFLGDLDQTKLKNWYEKCSIVVLPSYSEGLGRIILEAQAMKRPVIAYDVGGVPSAMINGETGYLVKKGDINSLASTIYELVNNEQKIKQMGEAGRKFVENKFNLDRLIESHENLYLRALNLQK